MINYYVGVEDVCFDNLYTASDIYEVLDAMHSKAMENCGATEDYNKSSEALEVIEKILEIVGYECEIVMEQQK